MMPWYDRPSWSDLNRQLDQNQADHFGEPFEIEPQLTRPNKRGIPDQTRPPHRIAAVFITNDQRSIPTARRMTDVAQHEIVVEFNAADLPFVLYQGDRLTRCATGETFEVLTPRSDGSGHMRVTLCEFRPIDYPLRWCLWSMSAVDPFIFLSERSDQWRVVAVVVAFIVILHLEPHNRIPAPA